MDINLLIEKCIKSAIDYGNSAFEVVEKPRKQIDYMIYVSKTLKN